MVSEIDQLTDRLYKAKVQAEGLVCKCSHAMRALLPSGGGHDDDCPLNIAYGEARDKANDQLWGLPLPQPDPPADEQGLTKAIEACENYATLKELTHQYCRDRWAALADRDTAVGEAEKYRVSLYKAVGERDAKQALLDDMALDRRRITLQLGDAVIELERMKERYNHVHAHREDLVAVAEQGKRYLEQIGMNPGLQARFIVAIENYGMEPEDKPEGKPNDPA